MNPERYSRQTRLPQWHTTAQDRLAEAQVVLVGAGGLGCCVAQYLVGAGVGHLTLVDHDVVSLSNLHRQTLYTEEDLGQPKVAAAIRRLEKANSEVVLVARQNRLSPSNIMQFCDSATLVIDAADNIAVSYLLSDAAMALELPLLTASVNQTFGYFGGFCNGHPSLRAVFPKVPATQTSCDTVGVTGPSVGVIASLQAQEALKILIGGKHTVMGSLVYCDLWDYQLHRVAFDNAKEPPQQIQLISAQMLGIAGSNEDAALVIDVRTPEEITESPQTFSVDSVIPLAEIQAQQHDLAKNQALILACQSGQRALLAGQALLDQGFSHLSVVLPD